MGFFLSEAGSRRGRSPRRHTHTARSPSRPGPALASPAASRVLPARLRGRSRKPAPGSCPPRLASSRPHTSSHLPAPQEEQDASSPCRAATGWEPSIASRDAAAAGYWEAGKGAGPRGQGAGGDVTGGGGPGGARSPAAPSRQAQRRPGFRFGCGRGVGFAAGDCREWTVATGVWQM